MSHLNDLINRPPTFGVIQNWLGAEFVQRLLEYARSNRQYFKDSRVGYGDRSKTDPSRRRSVKLRDFGKLKDEVQTKATAALPEMFGKLGSPSFIPSKIELELVAHQDGAFFARHKDTFIGGNETTGNDALSRRVISAVYYFNATPKAFSGGILRLHSLAENPAAGSHVDIEPMNDSLAFFPSWFPHEVTPVRCPTDRFDDSRFTINCWFHRA